MTFYHLYIPTFAKDKLVSKMRKIIFKRQTKTKLSLYSSILTTLLDIILTYNITIYDSTLNHIHLMNYSVQTMQVFAYSET